MVKKKIAVMVACGHFSDFGYSRIFDRFYESYRQIGDIFIVATTHHFRDEVGEKPGLTIFDQVQLNKNEKNQYIFDQTLFSHANNECLLRIKEMEYDILFQACINEFIPQANIAALRNSILDMGNSAFLWSYKSYVLGNKVFVPDIRLPWILNLSFDIRLVPDGVEINGDLQTIEAGFFLNKIGLSSYDCGWNISLEELRDKMNFVRCYSELEKSKGNMKDKTFSIKILDDYLKKVNKKMPLKQVQLDELVFDESIAIFLLRLSRIHLQTAATLYRITHGILRVFKL